MSEKVRGRLSQQSQRLAGRLSQQGQQLTGRLEPFAGVGDHSILRNRNLPGQHTMEAITGLEEAMNGKADADHVHNGYVPITRTINGKTLTDDIILTLADIGAAALNHTHSDYVPKSRKVNNKELTEDIELNATDVGALPTNTPIPTRLSQLLNDAGFLTSFTETDPTVPGWAKSPTKPSYTASEVGAVPESRKINGKALSADITLDASDVGALPANTNIPSKTSDLLNDSNFLTSFTETDPTVPAWAKSQTKPTYTAAEVGALPDDTPIPAATSDLTNDSGFITQAEANAAANGSIPYICSGQLDSTSTSKVMTAQIPGVTELKDGVAILLKNGVVTSASGWTLNINGLGAKPVYQTMAAASRVTTAFNINYTLMFIYNETRVTGGCWDLFYGYNTNTTYTNASLGQGYATCATEADTVAKVAALSSYALTVGGYVGVKFAEAVPAAATLNVNSKGAKSIYYKGAAITAGIIKAGDLAVFLYNGSQYHLVAVDRLCEMEMPDVSGKLDKTGGTMTGPLVLAGAPTLALHPATKDYVDTITGDIETVLEAVL